MAMIFGKPETLESLAFFKLESKRSEEQNERLQDLIVVTQHEASKSKKSRPQPSEGAERDFAEL